MSRRLVSRLGVYVLGTFGLLLVALVGKLAPHATAQEHTYPARVRAWLARRALDGIGVIGWLVDHVPPQASRSRRDRRLPGNRISARPAGGV